MPFKLVNVSSTFQHYINNILRPYLNIFCIIYINNILIYNNNLKNHQKHIQTVLQVLENTGLQFNVNKYEFHKTKILYLDLIISTDGIRINSTKIKTILK
jgi:hypothetical protein